METEARQLRAARRLADERPVVGRDDLPRRACPAAGSRWRQGCLHRPAVRARCCRPSPRPKLADAVDAFMEGIAFSGAQTARVFEVAKRLGLPVKLHADQLSNLGGANLAARYGALSADHLEYTDEAGAAAMAKAGTVAVLLPGAFYFLRETQKPPVELFRKHGARIAIATDSNPGSSPLTSLLLTMNMAATLFRLTVDEIIAGVTREAARALGRLRRGRHAGSGQVVRSRHLERRAAGRAALPHGLQSAACSGSGGAGEPCSRRHHPATGRGEPGRLARHLPAAPVPSSIQPACRRSRRAPVRSRPSWPRASRSTASTRASASSPACASRRPTWRGCRPTSCCRTRPASASRRRATSFA